MSQMLKVVTGELSGLLDLKRYGPCGRSVCILHDGRWMTPCEFRTKAKGSPVDSFSWKRITRLPDHRNISLYVFFRENDIKHCDKGCKCQNCRLALDHSKAKAKAGTGRLGPLKVYVSETRDTDSDSGISNVSSTVVDATSGISSQDLTTSSGLLPDYSLLVREAIASVLAGMPVTSHGCSRLCIMLYILTKHAPAEDVKVVNQKVKSSLQMLTRMGVIQCTGGSSEDETEQQHFVVKEEKKTKESEVKVKVKKKVGRPPKSVVKVMEKRRKVKSKMALKSVKKAMSLAKKSSSKVKTVQKLKERAQGQGQGRVVFQKPQILSAPLAAICGKKKMCRNDVVSKVWHHIRSKKLQDPLEKSKVLCDDKLKAMTKKDSVHQLEILSSITSNMTRVK